MLRGAAIWPTGSVTLSPFAENWDSSGRPRQRCPGDPGPVGECLSLLDWEEARNGQINKVCVGESLVGDGNEVAHIDLIMGPRGSAAETAFCNALTNNKDGFTTLLAVVAPNLPTKPNTIPLQQGDDQGRPPGGADVRPGAVWRRPGGGDSVAEERHPGRRGRRPVHLRRRVHSLGGADDAKIQEYNYSCREGSMPVRSPASPTHPRWSPSAPMPSIRLARRRLEAETVLGRMTKPLR